MRLPEIENRPLITAIGSLPYQDLRAGWENSLRLTPDFYCLPQLPSVELFEYLTLQPFPLLPAGFRYSQGLVQGGSNSGKELVECLEHAGELDLLPGFRSANGALAFLKSQAGTILGPRLKKYQWVGPITLALSIRLGQQSALYDSSLFSDLVRCLTIQIEHLARWCRINQIDYLFLDEPCLPAVESMPTELRDSALAGLAGCLNVIRKHGVGIGLHCCAELSVSLLNLLFDYSVSLSVDVVRRPDFLKQVLDVYASRISRDTAGTRQRLLLGCVSARDAEVFGESEVVAEWFRKCGEVDLEQLVLTPSCGLALATTETVERAFRELAIMRESFDRVLRKW